MIWVRLGQNPNYLNAQRFFEKQRALFCYAAYLYTNGECSAPRVLQDRWPDQYKLF